MVIEAVMRLTLSTPPRGHERENTQCGTHPGPHTLTRFGEAGAGKTAWPPEEAPARYGRGDGPELLRQCLASLSDLQREAIILAFYGEHTYAEVAVLLGVPLGAVKARIRGGLARLRYCMQRGPAARQLRETLESPS
jgi:DNA-directed RNA polymerase specialized sigma24 family protein